MILLMVMMIDVCMYGKQRGVQAAEGGERGGGVDVKAREQNKKEA